MTGLLGVPLIFERNPTKGNHVTRGGGGGGRNETSGNRTPVMADKPPASRPIYRVRISRWILSWIFELGFRVGFSSLIFELGFRV